MGKAVKKRSVSQQSKNNSSNIEVIRAVLNSFFLQKDFAHTKSTKNTKSTKSTKRHKDTQEKSTKCK